MSLIKIFFDTNVLVYAHDESANYHTESAELLQMTLEEKVQGIIAEQNIIELYRILTNPSAMKGNALNPSTARDLIAGTYLTGTLEILYPNHSTLDKVLELAVNGNFISARIFDIRLAALILDAGIDFFATYNISDFQGIPGLNPLRPPQILTAIPD
ncbi:putative PilT protein [Planktothrix serta PCC 8927]|uniref:PilT protein n=1 Tax=Planktothrix serta PCC 8927 TaxID=671068 RepID=A0A7Z9BS95_9CYAN|nr:PIN domain-containing protein [Planktothrix serta]VXD21809.1 putative PilT protein [Planktothrix serta PCC 8927]